MTLINIIRSAPIPVKYSLLVQYTKIYWQMRKFMSHEEAMNQFYKAFNTEVPQ